MEDRGRVDLTRFVILHFPLFCSVPRFPDAEKNIAIPPQLQGSLGPFGPRLWGHSRDTFWTLQSSGPEGTQRHPMGHSVGHPRFRGHSRGHSPAHSGLKGPRDPCSWSAGSQEKQQEKCHCHIPFFMLVGVSDVFKISFCSGWGKGGRRPTRWPWWGGRFLLPRESFKAILNLAGYSSPPKIPFKTSTN